MQLLTVKISPASRYFPILLKKYAPQPLFWNIITFSSLRVTDQASYSHKITGKIIVLYPTILISSFLIAGVQIPDATSMYQSEGIQLGTICPYWRRKLNVSDCHSGDTRLQSQFGPKIPTCFSRDIYRYIHASTRIQPWDGTWQIRTLSTHLTCCWTVPS